MKNKIISIISVLFVFLISCESNDKFLEEDPQGKLFPDNFLNDETELQLMNNALYFIWAHAMDRPYQSMELKFSSSDDILGTSYTREYYSEVNMEMPSDLDSDIQLGWERVYNTVNQANSIINNYHNADGNVDEATLNAYAGQAYFIRAFCNFWLVRFYNKMPLVTTAFQPDNTITLSDPAEVYELIISDLRFAEEWLPVTWSESYLKTGGAVTRGAAKAVLAKVYLQMAGYPVNGGTEYYELARDKAKEIIDDAGTYGYALRNHFYEIWDSQWQGYATTPDEAILWMSHSTVDPDYTVRSPMPGRPRELSGWELMVAEMGFFNRFPEGERKDFTFVTDFYVQGGTHYTYDQLSCAHPTYRKWWADNLSSDWNWENRATNLWATNMEKSATWYDSRSIVMLRYADILLTYAEAQARADGTPNTMAYQCLNDVRNRAYAGVGSTDATLSGLSTADFIDSVVWERAYEFAGFEYSARWFDLQRLELVEKASTDWRDESDNIYALQNAYTKSDYFLPIPSKEVEANPNLANNNQ